MNKIAGALLLFIGFLTSRAMALPAPPSAPEIDPGSAATALALVFGVGLMLRGRRKA
jgi:hypothetical protein